MGDGYENLYVIDVSNPLDLDFAEGMIHHH